MKVTALFENKRVSKEYKNKHGLSPYIETSKHKLLFDTGSDATFADNARRLGVRLEDVDIAAVSHRHYDHGGRLETFLKLNNSAKVYIGKGAFDKHITKILGIIKYNIGLNKELGDNGRNVFVDDTMKIDDELTLFGNVNGGKLVPVGNDRLLKKYGDGSLGKNDFEHEINLLACEKSRYSLFCGCTHKGIVNIIDRTKGITGSNVNTVVGGFHLMGMDVDNTDSVNFLNELSAILAGNNVDKYYTCHCTGEKAYSYLSRKLANPNEINTGMVIKV